MAYFVVLPELGDDIKEAVVVGVCVQEGDSVNADDDVVELVTDKAVFNVPAGYSGIIKSILVEEGQEVKIGDPLLIIE